MNTYLRRKLYSIIFNEKSSVIRIGVKNMAVPISAAKANIEPALIAKNVNCGAPAVSATPYLRRIAPGLVGAPAIPTIAVSYKLTPSLTIMTANMLSASLRAASLTAPGEVGETVSNNLAVSEVNIKMGEGVAPNISHLPGMIHQSEAVPASGEAMYPLNIISALQKSKLIGSDGVTAKIQSSQGEAVAAVKSDIANGDVNSNTNPSASLAIITQTRASGIPYLGNNELSITALSEVKSDIANVDITEVATDQTTTAVVEIKICYAADISKIATDETTVSAVAEITSGYADIAKVAADKTTIPAVSTAILKVGPSADADIISCISSTENVEATKGAGLLSRGANLLFACCRASMTTRIEEDPEQIDFDNNLVSNLDTYLVADIDAMRVEIKL